MLHSTLAPKWRGLVLQTRNSAGISCSFTRGAVATVVLIIVILIMTFIIIITILTTDNSSDINNSGLKSRMELTFFNKCYLYWVFGENIFEDASILSNILQLNEGENLL